MGRRRTWGALATSLTIGCFHVDVQSDVQCSGAHLELRDVSDAAANLETIPDGSSSIRPAPLSMKTSLSAALPSAVDFEIALSPLTLRLSDGDWRFAERVVVVMEGSDSASTDPPITIGDRLVDPAEADSSVLTIPLAVQPSTIVSYLRRGPVELSLNLFVRALPPPSDVDLEVCHSASASFNWNIVGGASSGR